MHSRCDHPAADLLPWYLNGTLEREEEARVGDHLADCAACGAALDVLTAVAREVGESELPILSATADEVSNPVAAPGRGFVWRIAAGIALPAAIGMWWFARGLPEGVGSVVPGGLSVAPPAAAPAAPPGGGEVPGQALAQVVEWDLKAMQRGDNAAAVFPTPHAAAETIAIGVPAPVAPGALFETELRGPTGTLLRREARELVLDALARTHFAFPAELLRGAGGYELLLREIPPEGGAPREYSFPFRVGVAGEPGRATP